MLSFAHLHATHPPSSKVIYAFKEHCEVAVIDRQIVPAEIPVRQRKAQNADLKVTHRNGLKANYVFRAPLRS